MVTTPASGDHDRHEIRKDADKEISGSIIADNPKNRLNGLMIVVIAVAATAVMIFTRDPAKSTSAPADRNLVTAERKEVEPLKQDHRDEDPMPVNIVPPAVPTVDPLQVQRDQIELMRAEKARQLLDARRKSALDPGGASAKPHSADLVDSMATGLAAPDSAGLQGKQDANSKFLATSTGVRVPTSRVDPVNDVEYKILQGKIIEGITVPRAISDLPGTICALVQRDVFAERGRIKLIPWGSRLCGVYSAELRKGQERLFTVWNTLRVANADGSISEVALDSVGSDQLGTAGMGGQVDSHFAEIFGTSALLSIIGAGSAMIGVSSGDQNNSAAQYRESVQLAAAQTAQSVLAPYINIPPTVTVPPGARVRIFVNRDLDFSSLYRIKGDSRTAQEDSRSF